MFVTIIFLSSLGWIAPIFWHHFIVIDSIILVTMTLCFPSSSYFIWTTFFLSNRNCEYSFLGGYINGETNHWGGLTFADIGFAYWVGLSLCVQFWPCIFYVDCVCLYLCQCLWMALCVLRVIFWRIPLRPFCQWPIHSLSLPCICLFIVIE